MYIYLKKKKSETFSLTNIELQQVTQSSTIILTNNILFVLLFII